MLRSRLLKLSFSLGIPMFVGGVALLASRFIGNRGALPLEIHAVAHQWWWEFDYPKLGVRVADEFHIPEGRRVRLELTSADVLHSFWLPPMKLAADVIPGQTRTLLFTSRSTGALDGSCNAGCGCNTVCMRFRVLITNESEFQKWIRKQRLVSLTTGNTAAPTCVLPHHAERPPSSPATQRLEALLANGSRGRNPARTPASGP